MHKFAVLQIQASLIPRSFHEQTTDKPLVSFPFTVQNIESYIAINEDKLVELSAQQLTSCTPNELECGGTGGCQGSIPQLAWTYTQLFGITDEASMPYKSGNTGQTGTCDYDPSTKVRGDDGLK